ncbi:Retrovirus-related Pol polyprotein from transposon 17.6 [Vitis vinifera]|uniref:Retrovirus-related Pol polyprotein from transposon 17.6 n=1 Tax=Vitis vinifera TaxID=29760 RepID=A0A438H0C3_VITVI|nr:Retrovirus-related Pol polyprotein from transposon 17.6 [Vitis vinifera]
MIMRSLQPRFARHLMGFPHTDLDLWYRLCMYRPPVPSRPMTPTYLHPVSQPVFAAHVVERPPAPYIRPRAPQTTTYVQRPPRSLLSWGPGHDTDHCTALRHAIQDLIDQGDIHHMDLIEDDSIHMLSWDDGLPEPIVLHDSYEVDGVSVDAFVPFTLWPEDDDSAGREIQIVTRSGRIAQPPPPAVRPFEGTASHEEVRREDDEVLRQLQSTQARISIWSLLASSSTHRDALIRALNDDLPPDGLDHVRPLYITVGCSGRRVPSVLLDNGSALNVCPLATAIALGFASSDFGPSTQTARAYDSTKREVMGTLMIDLQIGPATFSTLFQVLRIPASFNLLLGRPWIHVAGAIPFPFIRRDFVAMSFDQHSSTVVLDMMRGMTFLPGMGLGRRQQGPSEFIAAIDHDTTFGLGFIPIEADYRHMARLRKERLQLSDGAPDTFFPMTITPTSPDRASMLSLCFPEEITSDGVIVDPTEVIDGVVPHDEYRDEMDMMTVSQIAGIVQLQPVSAFDMFGISTIEVFEGTQTLPVPELPEDDSSLFEGIVSPVEGTSDLVDPPLSFDVLSGFVSRSDDIFDIDDEIAHPSSDRDSFDHDSGPIDERVSPAVGDVETVDFGTEDQPRELKIGSPLSTDERDRLIHLLMSYLDVFAWSYEDMPGLDPSIVQHHLPTLPHARPVKQKLRRLHPRWSLQVKEEIQKQLSVGFILVVEYPEWLANVVPVPKKMAKLGFVLTSEISIKPALKMIFPFHTLICWLMAPQAIRCCLSWMGFQGKSDFDGSRGYGEDTFITEWGTYCYRVMPFGLKNAGATYQRAATTLFHDMMHRDVEVYVDDMIVKSRGRADHLDALERFFERIRKFRLRLNPKKCTFGVTSGKLLGHIVSERGIEVDPDKIKAILDMPAPKTEKEIRGFLGRLQYISRFIARLTDICEPIFRLLRKNQPTVWNDDCQFAFEKIKDTSLGYQEIEALHDRVFSAFDIRLDPLRYLFDRPALTGRLMRWLVLLTEFDIQYVSQKSIKGSIVADHLASLPTYEDRPVDDDFPDEEFVAMTSLSGWCMYFDGAANQSGYGIGVLLVSPQGDHIPRSVRLAFSDRHPATNNIVEYEACILGLETALELDIRQMEVFGDSNLVLRQIQGDWKTRDVKLRPYHAYLELLVARFDDLRYVHLPRAQNRFADALATLASSVDIPIDVVIRSHYQGLESTEDLATRFVICGDTLYRRSADGMLLLCLDRASADRVMREVHSELLSVCPEMPECQIHGDLIHAPPSELHALTSPWPFSVWGIDIIGKVSPKSSSGHEFILVAIDYFTKWVEAASYARGAHFRAEVDTLLQEYGIRHHRSSAYRPQTNGAVEAANKNIKRILRKMVETSRDWSESFLLHFETEMGSLRVALEQQISETEWAQARFDQLNLLDERRLRAADHVQAYQRKMARAFKKRVKPRPLQKGDLVLRILRGLIGDPRGKFRPSWSGPYVIRELTPEGAAWLIDLDGNQFSEPTNVDQLKKYYV